MPRLGRVWNTVREERTAYIASALAQDTMKARHTQPGRANPLKRSKFVKYDRNIMAVMAPNATE